MIDSLLIIGQPLKSKTNSLSEFREWMDLI